MKQSLGNSVMPQPSSGLVRKALADLAGFFLPLTLKASLVHRLGLKLKESLTA